MHKLNSRASEGVERMSRDCTNPLIIKTRFNKLQRYVFKFVNSLVIIYASGFLAQYINYVIVARKMS